MRRLLATALAASAFVVLAEAPAQAAAPGVTDVDWTATPGHVTGTVSSDQPWVYVDLGVGDGVEAASWVGPQAFVAIDPSTGTGTFDLETWGLRSSSGEPQTIVAAASCTGDSAGACDFSVLATSPWFQPTDVRPSVTFEPADGKVGTDFAKVTSSDPSGGGELHADWVGDDGSGASTTLERNGTTFVTVTEGPGRLVVRRCMTANSLHCDDFDSPVQRSMVVNRVLESSAVADGPSEPLDPGVMFRVETDAGYGTLDLGDLTLTHTETGEVRTQPRSSIQPVMNAYGGFSFGVDARKLAPGLWTVSGHMTINSRDFGWLEGDLRAPDGSLPTFYVEPTPDAVVDTVSVSRSYLHAGHTGNIGKVNLDAWGTPGNGRESFVVLNSSGSVVRRLPTEYSDGHWFTWFGGRNNDGDLLPAGVYTVRLRSASGALSPQSATVQVKRRIYKTFTRTVTAAGSKQAQRIGRCSSLAAPSSHGWSGSLGLNSNTKCRDGFDPSLAMTGHAVKVPSTDVARYLDVRISAYGGAGRSHASSTGLLMYVRNTDGVSSPTTLGSKVGQHSGPRLDAENLILPDTETSAKWIGWFAATARGNRYDIKSFTVTVRYVIWR